MARIGMSVQKVTPPARKRCSSRGMRKASSQAERATASGTGDSKPASWQARTQSVSAWSSAASA